MCVCLFLFEPLKPAYHAYTSCIFLTLYLVKINPPSFVWIRTHEGRLIRSTPVIATSLIETATMFDNSDMEAFRRQLKEEIAADTKNLIREVIGEIL